MLLNYLKLSIRLMTRNPFFTVVNITGLALGFAAFYSLWGHAARELKSDQYHRDYERIARIGVDYNWTDDGGKTWGHLTFGFCGSGIAERIKTDFQEVESILRIHDQSDFIKDELVSHGKDVVVSWVDANGQKISFKGEGIVYADENLFSFFTIPLLEGSQENVLREANSVVLSKSKAHTYFGSTTPVGRLIQLNDSTTLKVTGVFEDLPGNSHLNFSMVISNTNRLTQWQSALFGAANTYVRLRHNNFGAFEDLVNTKTNEYWAELYRTEPHLKLGFFIQPLVEIPFSNNFISDDFYPKSKSFLFTLIFIALSVLAMAWVNYINLSVTRIGKRFKEIATRRVSGTMARDMAAQFVIESLTINAVACAFALTLIQLVKAPAKDILNIDIPSIVSTDPGASWIPIVLTLVGTLVTAIYPAVVAMKYQPRLLYSKSSPAPANKLIPNLLTTSQYAVAFTFILLAFNVSRQINHILSKEIGIRKEGAILIECPVVKPKDYLQKVTTLKKELSRLPGVTAATNSKYHPTRTGGGEFLVKRIGSDVVYGMEGNSVDEDYISFYGMHVIAGRPFRQDDQPDALVISRFAASRLGFNSPEEALGARINISYMLDWKEASIVGVIEDYRIFSYLNMNGSSTETESGRGIVLMPERHSFGFDHFVPEIVSINVSGGEFEKVMEDVHQIFDATFPGAIFQWSFLDDKVGEIYRHEEIARNQISTFTFLAILIAGLGLFGMISNRVVEKTKEIGVRKVMGARLHHIAGILVNTSVRQLAVAAILGVPIAYYFTRQYLNKYSEQVPLTVWSYLFPISILVLILAGTVTVVVIRAAMNNPVEALKHE